MSNLLTNSKEIEARVKVYETRYEKGQDLWTGQCLICNQMDCDCSSIPGNQMAPSPYAHCNPFMSNEPIVESEVIDVEFGEEPYNEEGEDF